MHNKLIKLFYRRFRTLLVMWMLGIMVTGYVEAQEFNDLSLVAGDPVVDVLAFSGLSPELATATESYFSAAMKLVADKGNWPKRKQYSLVKRRDVRPEQLERANFPVVVNLGECERVPFTLQILPAPKIVRHYFRVVPDFEGREQSSPIKWPDNWRRSSEGQGEALSVQEFFVPLANCSNWGFVHATPFDSPSVIGGNQTRTVGWLRTFCRRNSLASYEEFNHFPEYVGSRKDEAIWEGILASGQVDSSNLVLRWVALRNASTGDTTTWLAYFIEDACGAFSEPLGSVDFSDRGTHIRPMLSPFYPSLKVSQPGLEFKDSEAPSEHNLLRIPRPHSLVLSEKVNKWYSEEWTVCEQYYSEQKVPAWILSITKESNPYRESFRLSHALEGTDEEVWKLIVFSSIEPKSLIEVLGKIKRFDTETISVAPLEEHYSRLKAITRQFLDSKSSPPYGANR